MSAFQQSKLDFHEQFLLNGVQEVAGSNPVGPTLSYYTRSVFSWITTTISGDLPGRDRFVADTQG
jgi:hypothetical protein